ncbi:alpha-humulene synthase [Humulus lupulus]|uniref:alpha-humulene synthase n=1 Tax=Humulus lupulus TaxID=3486 RepID=UPI002B416A3B|nr:alpha-humulene synthase [Humulus lupulus]
MSTQILASSSQNEKIHKILRPTKKFQPSVWGERFLHYNISEQELRYKQQEVEELKAVVKKEIFGESAYDVSHQLKLINAVERLGLSYLFESEIENELESIYNKSVDQNYILKDENLHDASLRFRLLRQHGFRVSSPDIFEKFKDEDGNFKECLVSDTIGLLSLYEASHLSCVGENILDEALAFTTTHLTEFLANKKEHDDPLSKEISQALERPLRKSLERLAARHFISIYENETSHNKVLLQLAKLDFNLLQSMHKKELSEISRWWKESDFVHKFPFARDRIVELYLWILAVYYEPQYSLARNILTKIIALTSIADDIYDAYGTFEELEHLTEAVERWDINIIDKLNPEYLQTFYKELLNSYEEFEQELSKEETYRVHYAKERFKEILRSFLEEAWWLKEGRVPSFDEYLKFSLITCGYHMLIVNSLIGMKSSIVTKEVFEWFSMDRKIIRASSTICRFMDDIAEHKFEQEKNDEPTAVECYMKQCGVSEEEAYDELNKRIANAWKEINEELLKPTGVASPILVRALNFSKFMDLFYKNGDGYTQVGKVTKDSIAALLIDPIP